MDANYTYPEFLIRLLKKKLAINEVQFSEIEKTVSEASEEMLNKKATGKTSGSIVPLPNQQPLVYFDGCVGSANDGV